MTSKRISQLRDATAVLFGDKSIDELTEDELELLTQVGTFETRARAERAGIGKGMVIKSQSNNGPEPFLQGPAAAVAESRNHDSFWCGPAKSLIDAKMVSKSTTGDQRGYTVYEACRLSCGLRDVLSREGLLMYQAEAKAKSEAASEGITIQDITRASCGLLPLGRPRL